MDHLCVRALELVTLQQLLIHEMVKQFEFFQHDTTST